jgi:hypothetical protein
MTLWPVGTIAARAARSDISVEATPVPAAVKKTASVDVIQYFLDQ